MNESALVLYGLLTIGFAIFLIWALSKTANSTSKIADSIERKPYVGKYFWIEMDREQMKDDATVNIDQLDHDNNDVLYAYIRLLLGDNWKEQRGYKDIGSRQFRFVKNKHVSLQITEPGNIRSRECELIVSGDCSRDVVSVHGFVNFGTYANPKWVPATEDSHDLFLRCVYDKVKDITEKINGKGHKETWVKYI